MFTKCWRGKGAFCGFSTFFSATAEPAHVLAGRLNTQKAWMVPIKPWMFAFALGSCRGASAWNSISTTGSC